MDQRRIAKIRKSHNLDLLKRMRRGEIFKAPLPEDTYYPPRPIIKKDKEVVIKLYRLLK